MPLNNRRYERVRRVVQDLVHYVGQGLTNAEADRFTKQVLRAADARKGD